MFLLNEMSTYDAPLFLSDARLVDSVAVSDSIKVLQFRGGVPTPLLNLPMLANELGVKSIYVKDEATRLELGSFKALGGGYAVIRLVLQYASSHFGRVIELDEMNTLEVRKFAARLVFACATDGNHGRSVAQGSQFVGARSVVFVHSGVSEARSSAIARFGAEIVRVQGTYDDSVLEAARVSQKEGWTVLSDTSWAGYEHIPGLVMQGYTAMVQEAMHVLKEAPTHVFIQAGVGGLAATVAAYFAVTFPKTRPKFIVVEPDRAACLFESAKRGRHLKITNDKPTVMAMLECYEPSLIAWRILCKVSDAFMTICDEDAIAMMRRLARPAKGDTPIVAGESGAAGLAGLACALTHPHVRQSLTLTEHSRVFVINTEGATDAAVYENLVGMSAEEVLHITT